MTWTAWMLAPVLWFWDACVFLPAESPAGSTANATGKRFPCARLEGGRLLACGRKTELAAGVDAFWQGRHLWIRRGGRLEMLDASGMWRFCDAGLVAADVQQVDAMDRVFAGGTWFDRVEVSPGRGRAVVGARTVSALRNACRRQTLHRKSSPLRRVFPTRLTLSAEKRLFPLAAGAGFRDEIVLWVHVDFDWPEAAPEKTIQSLDDRREGLCAAALRLLEASSWLRDDGSRRRARQHLLLLARKLNAMRDAGECLSR